MPSGNLALYVDVENTSNALIRGLEKLIRRVEQDYGRIVVREAFACWSRRQAARDGLTELGFDLKEVNDLGQTGKNSADIHLVVDLLMTLAEREDITGVVIVSGDSDFGPLYRALRKSGRVVIGVLPGKHVALRVAQHSCTEVIPQEWLERSTGTPSRAASGPASVRPAPAPPRIAAAAPAPMAAPTATPEVVAAAIVAAITQQGGALRLVHLKRDVGPELAASLPASGLLRWAKDNAQGRWIVEEPREGDPWLRSPPEARPQADVRIPEPEGLLTAPAPVAAPTLASETAPADPDRLRTEAIAAIDQALAAHGGRMSLGNLRTTLGAAAAGIPKNNLVAWLRRNGDGRWEVEGPLAGNATLCLRGAPGVAQSGVASDFLQ